ncbi:MAG: hypothetical protein LBQ12_12490 [Deltaproteobacteria bacterium]|nr:hypothetical protein [Deltaproteobacteria bacterium]
MQRWRKGLTPLEMTAVYAAGALPALLHESGRLAAWPSGWRILAARGGDPALRLEPGNHGGPQSTLHVLWALLLQGGRVAPHIESLSRRALPGPAAGAGRLAHPPSLLPLSLPGA